VEDGSCEFSGCTDPKAQNFDPAANVDDGSCCYSDAECSDIDGFTYLQENDQGYDEFRHDETGIVFVRPKPYEEPIELPACFVSALRPRVQRRRDPRPKNQQVAGQKTNRMRAYDWGANGRISTRFLQ
jgi:hypothetical protein